MDTIDASTEFCGKKTVLSPAIQLITNARSISDILHGLLGKHLPLQSYRASWPRAMIFQSVAFCKTSVSDLFWTNRYIGNSLYGGYICE